MNGMMRRTKVRAQAKKRTRCVSHHFEALVLVFSRLQGANMHKLRQGGKLRLLTGRGGPALDTSKPAQVSHVLDPMALKLNICMLAFSFSPQP
jgi:hypothetical protein